MTFFLLSLILLLLLEDVCYAKDDGPRLLLFGLLVDERCYVLERKEKTTCITYTYNVQTDTYAGKVT